MIDFQNHSNKQGSMNLRYRFFDYLCRGFLLLFLCFSSLLSAETSSFTDNTDYTDFCQLAIQDTDLFASFKRNSRYSGILEHVSFDQGHTYLSVILQQTPEYVDFLELFKDNDKIGNPNAYSYDDFGTFSPTTLRYAKVASDLQTLFGSLADKDIIEIGGGYGGQSVILGKLFKYKSYTIVDLPGPLALTKKYLELLGITNVSLITEEELPENKTYDLVISNYAFSECYRTTQQAYLNKILFRSKCGYLTCNRWEKFAPPGKSLFSKDELLNVLHSNGVPCQMSPESPLTGQENYFVIWGH